MPSGSVALNAGAAPALVVLDTNVVLDWLLFRNAGCDPLIDAVTQRRVEWTATEAMLTELDHVLGRPALSAWRPDRQAINAACRRWVRVVEPVAALPHAPALCCRDHDDQMFIDLARQLTLAPLQRTGPPDHQPVAGSPIVSLVTRDRALLALGRRSRLCAIEITPPERWQLREPTDLTR